KKELCTLLSQKPAPNLIDVAYQYAEYCFRYWIWNKRDRWLATNDDEISSKRKKERRPLYPEVEEALTICLLGVEKFGDATTYCAEAWSAVTETTVKNCWRKTGILPLDNETSTVNELNVGDDFCWTSRYPKIPSTLLRENLPC
ncbi:7500_t:CDS:2, partial [Paraglomus occultum]